MLTVYRIAYGLVLVLFLVNVLWTQPFTTRPAHVFVLVIGIIVGFCCVIGLLLGFSRFGTTAFWVLVLAWEGLFTWYAWFSPTSPFALHELHSLDVTAAAQETTMHHIWAGGLFALLFVWFFSLPVIRSIYQAGAPGFERT